jgi:hypothetical protein
LDKVSDTAPTALPRKAGVGKAGNAPHYDPG